MIGHEEKAVVLNTTFGATIFGLTLNEWVAIITFIYFIMQIGLLIPKYHEKVQEKIDKFKNKK